MGKVYITGGGPGDVGYLTLRAAAVIEKADCIIYDALINPAILKMAKPECELIYVGKRSAHHTMKQEKINQLLADKSRQVDCVVRLKGGDPYVFGRGGEEGIYLKALGISFEVIPGISSALAGLSAAGIPITHRGIAQGFHVISAHNRKDELSEIDFQALAQSSDTCVFLMGLGMLEKIVHGLLQAGKDKKSKIALISNATFPSQKVLISDLEHLLADENLKDMTAPALIVVGEVIDLREQLNFKDERCLHQKRFLVPKIGHEASPLAEKLREYGAEADEVEVAHLKEIEGALDHVDVQKLTHIVFSSRSAVRFFMKAMHRNHVDIRCLSDICFVCVGKATAEELENYGIYTDLMPTTYTSEACCELLIKHTQPTDKILIPKVKGSHEQWQPLAAHAQVMIQELYENIESECKEIAVENYDGIVFTCGSAVERLLTKITVPEKCAIYSIGPKTSEVLRTHHIYNYKQAAIPMYDALAELMAKEEK